MARFVRLGDAIVDAERVTAVVSYEDRRDDDRGIRVHGPLSDGSRIAIRNVTIDEAWTALNPPTREARTLNGGVLRVITEAAGPQDAPYHPQDRR